MIVSYYFKESYLTDLYSSKAFDFYFEGLSFGVLDIETTGLDPRSSAFIAGGILSFKEKSFEQYFVEDLSEEKEVLKKFIERLKHLDVILTYNGQSFDIPFILKRAKALDIALEFELPYNLDLYLVLNTHSYLRKFLPNLKQKTIENFMGLWADRVDEISGKESIDLYYSYLKTKDLGTREIILLHNKDDVIQLSKLLPVIEKTDFHKAMHYLGFIVKPVSQYIDSGNLLNINKIYITGKELSATGNQVSSSMDYYSYGNSKTSFNINFKKLNNSFHITIPLETFNGNLFLDARKFIDNFQELENYAFFEKDFLIVKAADKINYLETNHFIKLFLNNLGELKL